MGGGVLRTAAKAAGVYLPSVASATASVATARRASAKVPAAAAGGAAAVSLSGENFSPSASVDSSVVSTWPVPEVDDWEFADWRPLAADEADKGGKVEERFVFGPVPSLQEAKEATDDLREAIEKMYYVEPPSEVVSEEHVASVNVQSSLAVPSIPNEVARAFSLLQGSSEAQSVVASLAADKNVWDAVMKNEMVLEFYRNKQAALSAEGFAGSISENLGDATIGAEHARFEQSTEGGDFWSQMKDRILNAVEGISDLFQGWFKNFSVMHDETQSPEDSAGHGHPVAIGGGLIALVIAVIVVVLVKRA